MKQFCIVLASSWSLVSFNLAVAAQTRATADLSTTGARQAEQVVSEITGLTSEKHTIAIINR